MTKSIKNAVSDALDGLELSEEKLIELQDLARSNDSQNTKNQNIEGWFSLAKVASFIGLFVFISYFGIEKYQTTNESSLIDQVIAEVVKNHSHLKPLEVASDNLDQVSAYFDKLSFLPFHSQRRGVVTEISQQLIGGRYCSIDGNTAAQLRMQDDAGQFSTLFQTKDTEQFNAIFNAEDIGSEIKRHRNGYEISLWREKGLFMVLVKPAQ